MNWIKKYIEMYTAGMLVDFFEKKKKKYLN